MRLLSHIPYSFMVNIIGYCICLGQFCVGWISSPSADLARAELCLRNEFQKLFWKIKFMNWHFCSHLISTWNWIVDKKMCNTFSNSGFHLELVYNLILIFAPAYLCTLPFRCPFRCQFWPHSMFSKVNTYQEILFCVEKLHIGEWHK